jgi:hypothetical protein
MGRNTPLSSVGVLAASLVVTLAVLLITLSGLQNEGAIFRKLALPMYAALAVMWALTLIQLRAERWKRRLSAPLRRLRGYPLLYTLGLMTYVVMGLLLWILVFQPAAGSITLYEHFLLVSLLWGFVLLLCFGLDVTQIQTLREWMQTSRLTGVLISLATILLILFGVEIGMRMLLVMSDRVPSRLMQQWERLYWKPTNSLGYRDYELHGDTGKHILVVGDSFTAGGGVVNIDDTFPHILERALHDEYTVNIVANSGWDTRVEQQNLVFYPYQPDILILSYFLNDIEPVAAEHGLTAPENLPLSPPFDWLVDKFYVPNFMYWHIFNRPPSQRLDRLLLAYQRDDIWQAHSQDLLQIVEWARERNIPLLVIIWPFLDRIEVSLEPTAQVEVFFTEQQTSVINLTHVLQSEDPTKLVVNIFDVHPNPYAHAIAAQQIYETLAAQGSVTQG